MRQRSTYSVSWRSIEMKKRNCEEDFRWDMDELSFDAHFWIKKNISWQWNCWLMVMELLTVQWKVFLSDWSFVFRWRKSLMKRSSCPSESSHFLISTGEKKAISLDYRVNSAGSWSQITPDSAGITSRRAGPLGSGVCVFTINNNTHRNGISPSLLIKSRLECDLLVCESVLWRTSSLSFRKMAV